MVKLRLKRMGRKKRPFYRIVAMDINTQRDGAALAQVGVYDPIHAKIDVDAEAAISWLNQGAQMSETVQSLFKTQGILARWKGLEGTVKEDALTQDKPKRRKKLAAAEEAAAAPEAEEGEATGSAPAVEAEGDDEPVAATEEATAGTDAAEELAAEAAPESKGDGGESA